MFETSYSFKGFFSSIMKWMFGGLLITAATSALSTGIILYASYGFSMLFTIIALIASIAELILVWQFRKKVQELDYESARKHFILFSIAEGLSLGVLFTYYSPFAIVLAFATTCAYFGLLYSITTVVDTDFSMVGSICISAIIPLIIASIILVFINAEAVYWFVTYAGIAIFTGLTLYDFKRIEAAYSNIDYETENSMILYLALELYLDFLNLFIYVLRLTTRRR